MNEATKQLITYKTAASLPPQAVAKSSACPYAGNFCYDGSTLKECIIASNTSCEHHNKPDLVAKCPIKQKEEWRLAEDSIRV